MRNFNEYMYNKYEYPHPDEISLITTACGACGWQDSDGICFSYISSTFLNGWINYVKIDLAYLVTRYCRHEENVADLEEWNRSPPFHADLSIAFDDDVHILARGRDRAWWYFWYDRDCSDCVIGRFVTSDADDDVRASFLRHLNIQSEEPGEGGDIGPALAIDPNTIRGWVKG